MHPRKFIKVFLLAVVWASFHIMLMLQLPEFFWPLVLLGLCVTAAAAHFYLKECGLSGASES